MWEIKVTIKLVKPFSSSPLRHLLNKLTFLSLESWYHCTLYSTFTIETPIFPLHFNYCCWYPFCFHSLTVSERKEYLLIFVSINSTPVSDAITFVRNRVALKLILPMCFCKMLSPIDKWYDCLLIKKMMKVQDVIHDNHMSQ